MTETDLAGGRRRWDAASLVWFLFMAGSWIAFGALAAASPETVADFWSWARGLSLAAELGIWVATLPWLLATGVLEASWDAWLRVFVLIAIVGGWTLASRPRATNPQSRSTRPGATRRSPDTAAG